MEPAAEANLEMIRRLDALLASGEPDWSAVDFDVPCSRCGYDLRMLAQPRCPECGLQFQWRSILGPRLLELIFEDDWHSNPLFEYHAARRPVRSLLTTLRRSMNPVRFWRNVSIHDVIRPNPLGLLLIGSAMLFAVTFVGAGIMLGATLLLLAGPIPDETGRMIERLADRLMNVTFGAGGIALILMVPIAFWAAFTLVVCLRQTLGRCKVRSVQVLRVFAYAAGPAAIGSALLCAVGLLVVAWLNPSGEDTIALVLLGILGGLPAWLGFYLVVPLRVYLQLPQPALLGLTAAYVGYLFSVTLIAILCVGFG